MSFFKAYDMRGTFGVDFDLETVYKVGRALPGVIQNANRANQANPADEKPRILVGRDCRTTSEDVRNALVKGLEEAGAEVTDLGLCTTPMVYFFTAEDDYDGSVMITASHNPPSDNGLKVSMRTALPVGYANGLNEVEKIVRSLDCSISDAKAGEPGAVAQMAESARSRYVDWQRQSNSRTIRTIERLRFAVDCSNGMASLLVHELFPSAVIVNDTLDGTFPNHSPNPLKAEAREQIAALVREKGLDCGVIFDGDADRCMFVDEKGEFVQPDYLIPVVAKATMRGGEDVRRETEDQGKDERRETLDSGLKSQVSRPRVIHDVRTSRGAIEEIRRMGCEPVMVPVGHAFAKPILRETGAVCGGELAGHYYFSEFHGCDSGVLAALRILGEVAKAKANGKTFSQMMQPISGVYANSGEMNFKVEDKDAAIARVLASAAASLPPPVSRSEIDGIRIEYDEGWVNIRKSNTEPYLRLIVECDTAERLGAWTGILKGAINDEK